MSVTSAADMPRGVTTTGGTRLPYTPASVSRARREFLGDVGGRVPAQVCEDALLIMSELLGNALRHARPLPGDTLEVSWEITESGVEIAVTDGGGSTRPEPKHPSLSALGGRGLAIVDAITERWGVRDDQDSVTVWAEVTAQGSQTLSPVRGRG